MVNIPRFRVLTGYTVSVKGAQFFLIENRLLKRFQCINQANLCNCCTYLNENLNGEDTGEDIVKIVEYFITVRFSIERVLSCQHSTTYKNTG